MNIYRGFFQFYLILLNIYKGSFLYKVFIFFVTYTIIQNIISSEMYFHMLGHLLALLDFKMPLFFTFVCLLYVSFHYIIMCYIYIALFWVLKALYIDGGDLLNHHQWIFLNISEYICEDIDIHLLFKSIVKFRQAHKHFELFLKAALQRNRSCFIWKLNECGVIMFERKAGQMSRRA